jgi:hypothetical protein
MRRCQSFCGGGDYRQSAPRPTLRESHIPRVRFVCQPGPRFNGACPNLPARRSLSSRCVPLAFAGSSLRPADVHPNPQGVAACPRQTPEGARRYFRGGKGVSRRAYSPHGTKHSGCRLSRADCHGDHGHKPLGDNSRRTEQHCSHDKTKPLDGLNRHLLARCEVCFRLERLGTPAYVRGSKSSLGTPISSPSRLSTLRPAEARRSCAAACGEFEGPR